MKDLAKAGGISKGTRRVSESDSGVRVDPERAARTAYAMVNLPPEGPRGVGDVLRRLVADRLALVPIQRGAPKAGWPLLDLDVMPALPRDPDLCIHDGGRTIVTMLDLKSQTGPQLALACARAAAAIYLRAVGIEWDGRTCEEVALAMAMPMPRIAESLSQWTPAEVAEEFRVDELTLRRRARMLRRRARMLRRRELSEATPTLEAV